MKDILITGVPRSGTSLLTKLLSQQEDVLCFSEPRWLRDIRHPKQTAEEFSVALKNKITSIREDIKKGNPVIMTVKKGSHELPDNYFKRTDKGQKNFKETKEVFVEHSDKLTIVVKSNTLFTACLEELMKKRDWKIYAMVRDPLYTLLSWRSLDIPVSRGEIKIGEVYSSDIRRIVKEEDILKRQVLILNWFLNQFRMYECQQIKYEDFIDETKKIVSEILRKNINKEFNLDSQNLMNKYRSCNMENIKEYLDNYLIISNSNVSNTGV